MKENEHKEIRNFLESYETNRKMLSLMRYEKEYFGGEERDRIDCLLVPGGDEVFLRAKMYEVRRFVMSIEDSNVKLLLFYHYIRGIPVEKCAELLGIGRSSAFRLKRRALEYAEKKFFEKKASISKLAV
ncbi:MAG: hypothetical protein ACI4QZ_01120 [Eubacteriales bacterium]